MIFNTQLSKIVVHKKEIESKVCCLCKSLFKRFFQLQYIKAFLQMLTAVLSSFYNQDMKAGSVDPRQMRVVTPFVKSSGRHLRVFCLSVLQISGSYTQTVRKFFHYHYSNLLKTVFSTFPLWGMMEIDLLFPWVPWLWGSCLGEMPQCRATATSLCTWGWSQPTEPLCLQGGAGLDGNATAPERCERTPSSPVLPVLLGSALVPSLGFYFSWSHLGWALLFRVLHALYLSSCSSALCQHWVHRGVLLALPLWQDKRSLKAAPCAQGDPTDPLTPPVLGVPLVTRWSHSCAPRQAEAVRGVRLCERWGRWCFTGGRVSTQQFLDLLIGRDLLSPRGIPDISLFPPTRSEVQVNK